MSHGRVARLKRPYDVRVLIEAYVYTQRTDFVHPDFTTYYASLLDALQQRFGVRLEAEGLSFDQRVLWGLFRSTVGSLLQITNPWAGYLEEGLVVKKLEESGEPGRAVHQASAVIVQGNRTSEAAHRDMLAALLLAIFGDCQRIVTSEELQQAGFDDSREPDVMKYLDYF